MFKRLVYLALFIFINLGFLLLAYAGQTQGVISLPQTGQTKCYDISGAEINCAGTGQDGELQVGVEWPDPRFTVSGSCVTDKLTGLMWAKDGNLPNGQRSWQGALNYVASKNSGSGLCGYKDWRLPNINELESLVNAGESNTATWLNSQGFMNVQSAPYWSSSTHYYHIYSAWYVWLWFGDVEYTLKDSNLYVWPVRSGQGASGYSDISITSNPVPLRGANVGAASEQAGFEVDDTNANEAPAQLWKTGQTYMYVFGDDGDLEKGVAWPAPRFIGHGDGTVTDNLTGLMWTRNANLPNGTRTRQGALDYVKTLSTGGRSDWRLPNRKELFSLIDRNKVDPALPKGHPFQNVQSDYYWSSTTDASSGDDAWIVHMWDGFVRDDQGYGYYVWPVRSELYPDISVTPNPVAFGNVNVGGTSDNTATLQNDGNADLVIGDITQPGQPFSKIQDNCSGQTIAPHATCTVTYRFAPAASGNLSSNSDIPSNDPDENPVIVTLNGTGSTLPSLTVSKSGAGVGIVTSSPAGINCGDDCSVTYTKATKVKLTAKADASSAFTGWSGGGCSGTKSCTVIVDTAVIVTADFALKTPDISVPQTSLDFLSLKVGKKVTKTLKIMNNGTGDLVVTLSGLEGPDFGIKGSSSITIKAKKSYSLKVLFTPKSAGSKTVTLEIGSNDPDTPAIDILLSGTGQ